MAASKNQYQKALDKARAMGGARNIVSRRGDLFTVRGSVAPTTYGVLMERPSMELHCGCPAGSRDLPCWHAACVWLARKAAESQHTHHIESPATLPPAPRSELLGVRGPLPTEGEGPSAYDLLMAGTGR